MKFKFFGLLFLLLINTSFAEEVLITKIEQKIDRGYDYLDVYTTGWTEARGLLMQNKLYIDFPGAKITKNTIILKRKSKRIRSLEAIQKDENTARVIVTLKQEIDYDIVNVFGRNKSVIEVGDRLENIYAYQFAWEKKYLKKEAPPLKIAKLEPVPTKEKMPLSGKVIILDPGHGGDDPGCFSAHGVPEKDLTLQTAKLTAENLRKLGATVYLTRNEDRRSNLKDIVDFANKTDAHLFISLHFNATPNNQISGTETYFFTPQSQKFAEIMHEKIVRGIRRKDRGLHRTPFYVIKNTNIPSVLLEPIYLSHPEESSLANLSSFQEELTQDIVKGVKEYFRSKRR